MPVPFAVTCILGSALAIFIAFRNNSSYSRWWEARTQWGQISNASRVLSRLVITFTDSHAGQANYQAERAGQFKKSMIRLTIAWANALRIELRNQSDWDQLIPYLSPSEHTALVQSHNKPNYLQLLAGKKLYEAMGNGTLVGFDSFQIEGQLLALTNAQGACERIKHTPLLRQYHYFTRLFLFTFILIFPFSILHELSKNHADGLIIPLTLIVGFVFAIIGKVGEVNEEPFRNAITDVPMTAICQEIERDLMEMLGEEMLPGVKEPEDGYLF